MSSIQIQKPRPVRRALLAGAIAGATMLGIVGSAQAYVPTVVAQGNLATNPSINITGGVAAAAMSPDGRYGYYSLDSNTPATPQRGPVVEKFDLTTMLPVSAVELPSTFGGGFGFAITPDGATAYGSYNAGRVAKVDLTSTPITHTATLTVTGAPILESLAMSPDGAYLYTVSQTAVTPRLFKIRLSDFTEVAAVALPAPAEGGMAVTVSPDGSKVWVAANDNLISGVKSSTIVEFDAATMTAGRSVTLSTAKNVFAGAISSDGAYGYYESDERNTATPPTFTKVNLATMTEAGRLTLATGEYWGAMVLSADGTQLYAGTANWPAHLNTIRTSDMTRTDGITLPTGVNGADYGALTSKNEIAVYLGTYDTPPYEVVKVQVRPAYALTVTKSGKGSGTVTSAPTGIDCGATCTTEIVEGKVVTLTAAAADGSVFHGWSGGCTGTAATCTVTMSKAETVTATFNLTPVPKTKTTFKVVKVTGSGTKQTALLRAPGAGKLSLSGTRKVGGKAVNACSRVTRTVSKAGTFALTCKITADAQAARHLGPVTIRLTRTYKPANGKAQKLVRIIRLSAIGTTVPVTG